MRNTFCHRLNIDFTLDLNALMKRKIQESHDMNKQSVARIHPDPALIKFLKQFNLTCNQARIFYTPPRGKLRVHADSGHKITGAEDFVDVANNQYTHTVKINWVFGAESSTMSWWKPLDASGIGELLTTTVGSPYISFDENKCTKIWSEHITEPCLLNVGQPHSVENNTFEGRWCMSFAISDIDSQKVLTWEDACERLKNYIK
jgi:hypothetical protein